MKIARRRRIGEPALTGSQTYHRRALPVVDERVEVEGGPVSAEFDPPARLHVPTRIPVVKIVGALRFIQIIGALRGDVQIVDVLLGDTDGPTGGVGH